MANTPLGGAVELLRDFGFFDVILPFLLVFTIVFGVLEKTKLFGTEKIRDKEYPKKNLNAMVAFVIAFFVIATKEIVEVLQVSLPLVALVLIALICFMLLAGAMFAGKTEDFFKLDNPWIITLTIVMFVAVVLIFFYTIGWLDAIIEYIMRPDVTIGPVILFFIILILLMYFVVGGKPEK